MIKRAHLRLGSRKWNPTIYKGGTEYKAVNIYGNYAEYEDSGIPKIPSGYTLVPYIECLSGMAYINTGLFADKTTRVVADLTFPSSNSTYPRIFTSGNEYTYCLGLYIESGTQIRMKYFTGGGWPDVAVEYSYSNNLANKRILFDYVPQEGLYVEYNLLIQHVTSGEARTSPGHIMLLINSKATSSSNIDAVGTKTTEYCRCKQHEWRIYTGGELVSNLFPVTRDSDSEPGLYDTVRELFFTSPNGNHFTAGSGEWTPHPPAE